jgi:hypothetical protein
MRSHGLLLMLFLCSLVTAGPAFAAMEASTLDAGVELSHITYKEPGIMKEDGMMYGVALSFTHFRRPGFKLEGRISRGQVDYTGQDSTGTPLTIKNINDTMFETRGLWGPVIIPLDDGLIIPWIGAGYRYLFDGLDKTIGGYRRESNYLYLPLAAEFIPYVKEGWKIGGIVEFDYFLRGRQISYLSDIDPQYNDIKNNQDKGWGARASLKFYGKGALQDVVIEPFVRFWRIAESDTAMITYHGAPVGVGWEPENRSFEYGLRASLWF